MQTTCFFQKLQAFVVLPDLWAPVTRRQIRNKASRTISWQKRRSSAARIHPMTTSHVAACVKQDPDFFDLRGSTVWGVFIPRLRHRFKYTHTHTNHTH